MAAFLEVITRHLPARAALLALNTGSLEAQTDGDWRQTLLVDEIGRGIGWAQAQLATFEPSGDYVWILDDDNIACRPALVTELKKIVAEHDPDVIMVRTDRLYNGVIPNDYFWQRTPELNRIDAACAIVRRATWRQHAEAWTGARYQSDYDFIRALFDGGARAYWHDVMASRAQRISLGAPG